MVKTMTTHTVRKILMDSLPVLGVVLVFALIAGQFLDYTLEGLKLIFPLILLMVPAFIDITGDLAGVDPPPVAAVRKLRPPILAYESLQCNAVSCLLPNLADRGTFVRLVRLKSTSGQRPNARILSQDEEYLAVLVENHDGAGSRHPTPAPVLPTGGGGSPRSCRPRPPGSQRASALGSVRPRP